MTMASRVAVEYNPNQRVVSASGELGLAPLLTRSFLLISCEFWENKYQNISCPVWVTHCLRNSSYQDILFKSNMGVNIEAFL